MAATFFPYLVAFAWVSFFILMGVFLRAKIPFFQRGLVPSSIIAGFLGFIAINCGWLVVPTPTGWIEIQPSTFGVITFHLFAIGFVGIGLLRSSGTADKSKRSGIYLRGSLWIAFVFTFSYAVQALLGYGIFSGWHILTGSGDNPIIGYLFGTGFTQGPGQALAYSTIWEEAPYHVHNAINIGLTFAAMGFFASVVLGVPLARYGLRKGWTSLEQPGELPDHFVKGIMTNGDQASCARTITHSANIDTFAYHMAIIFLIYGLAYAFGIWWLRTMPDGLAQIGVGMTFMWAMCIAKLVRVGASATNMDQLIDDGSIRRFTGMSVDFMVAAVFMSIELKAIQGMLIPILLTIILGSAITLGYILWLGRRAPELGFERTLVTLGTCTGTIATGLLLLRIADPDFHTSVAEEIGLMNFVTTFTCAPIIYFGLPFAARADFPMFWIFLATAVIMPVLIKVTGLMQKPKF